METFACLLDFCNGLKLFLKSVKCDKYVFSKTTNREESMPVLDFVLKEINGITYQVVLFFSIGKEMNKVTEGQIPVNSKEDLEKSLDKVW